MFFKKMEMVGFKSFATKTTIEFFPGITIVVGPNGCGKSNIFDAIRWVLGEQSAKSLRASRMADVVFNGSSSYKPLGFAQVSLTFSNEDRCLPLDFSEVVVTRRLFRTGESEYLLNKVPCRLRDIVELFMDTGMGTDAYSIMEQGKVDLIINAKPAERRYIFEEAAGIAKYKLRKEEALRKLVRTEEDLLRLTDIIAEVKRSSISLKRQATRAERYKELVEERRTLEMQLLTLRYQSYRDNRMRVEQSYHEVNDRLQKLNARIAQCGAESEELQDKVSQLTQQLAEAQAQRYSVASDIEKAEHQISLVKERISHLDERAGELEQELAQAEAQHNAVSQAIGVVQEKKNAVEQEIEERERAHEATQRSMATLKEEHERQEAVISSQLEKQKELRDQRTQEENARCLAAAMMEQFDGHIAASRKNLMAAQHELLALEEKRTSEQTRLHQATQSLTELRQTLVAVRERITGQEKELSQLDQKIEIASAHVRDLRSRLKVLQELEASYAGYGQGVRRLMQAAAGTNLTGIVDVLAKVLSTEKVYEMAIEATLDEALQAVIATTMESACQAMAYLKEQNLGRVLVYPLDRIAQRNGNGSIESLLGEEGVIGIGSKLVSYDQRFEPVVSRLLGNTLVVRDMSCVRRLEARRDGAQIVTLDGTVLRSDGGVVGGSKQKRGLLSREREMKELEQELTRHEPELEQLRSRQEHEEAVLRTNEEEQEHLLGQLREREIEHAQLTKDVEMITATCDEKKKAVEQSEQKEIELEAERTRLAEECSARTTTIASLDLEIQQMAEELGGLERAVQNANIEMDKAAEQMSALLVEIASRRERFQALSDKEQALAGEQEAHVKDAEQKRSALGLLTNEKKNLAEGIQRTEREIQQLCERRDTLDTQMTYQNQEKETLQLRLKELAQELQELQRDGNSVQNELHELDIQKTQYLAQEENLAAQAEEKFGRSIEQVLEQVGTVQAEKDQLVEAVNSLREKIENLGTVNPTAIEEYKTQRERYLFLIEQEKDLMEAKASLTKTIARIDETTTRLFTESFQSIRSNFSEMFRRLFNGGRADLVLVDEEGVLDSGIDIVAQPPGKKLQSISLLSGGEKALTAIALLFAIFHHRPSPFCVLDEIDAPLDDANTVRFKELLKEFGKKTQFIVITHNKQTMTLADTIYGITMEEAGVSNLVSVKFDQLEEAELVG